MTLNMNEGTTPATIEFAGMAVSPFRYSANDHVEEGGLVVTFQATVTGDEAERLRRLQIEDGRSREGRAYHSVTRQGIDSEPIAMRFGRVLWQARDDGSVDYQITLVSEQHDENNTDAAFMGIAGEPERLNLVATVSRLSAQMDALLDGLGGAALDPDLAGKVREAGKRGELVGRFAFYEVDDLADYWLD